MLPMARLARVVIADWAHPVKPPDVAPHNRATDSRPGAKSGLLATILRYAVAGLEGGAYNEIDEYDD